MEIPWIVVIVILAIALAAAVICGKIAQSINEEKGYTGGFWQGFFWGIQGITMVENKPDLRKLQPKNEKPKANGGWKCTACSTLNEAYVMTCQCGRTKADNERAAEVSSPEISAADEIAKFKTLLDNGAITEEEYAAKKKQLLGL